MSAEPENIKGIQAAITEKYGCDSRYVESVPVHITSQNGTEWDEIVAVVDLIEHRNAKRAYAWQFKDGNETKTLAVLSSPTVNSPESAVRLIIV